MNTTYKQLKNYFHNELGLSKQWIREFTEEIIKEEVRSYIVDTGRYGNVNRIIIQAVKQSLNTQYHTNNAIKDCIKELVDEMIDINVVIKKDTGE